MASTSLSAQEGAWQNPEFGALVDVLVARGLLGDSAVVRARQFDAVAASRPVGLPLAQDFDKVTPTQWARKVVLYLVADAFQIELVSRTAEHGGAYDNERLAETMQAIISTRSHDDDTDLTNGEKERIRTIYREESIKSINLEYALDLIPGDAYPYPSRGGGFGFSGDLDRADPVESNVRRTYSVGGQTRRKLIDLVAELELAPVADIARVRTDLEAGLISYESMVLSGLTEGISLVEQRNAKRTQVSEFIDSLSSLGILVDGDQLDKLRSTAASIGLHDGHELSEVILTASPRAVHLAILPDDIPLGDRYVAFLRKLSEAVAALQLSEPRAESRSSEGLKDHEWIFAISYRVKDTVYREEMLSYVMERPNLVYDSEASARSFDLHRLIEDLNQHLVDREIDLGLQFERTYGSRGTDADSAWVIPITRREAATLSAIGDGSFHHFASSAVYGFSVADAKIKDRRQRETFALSPEQLLPYVDEFDFDTPQRSAESVAALVAVWRELGLLEGLSEGEIATSTQRAIHVSDGATPGGLYRCFPRRVVYFDWESAERDSAYLHLLREFELAGRGRFSLSNITDEFPAYGRGGPYAGSFELGGETYSFRSQGHGDWLDGAFLEALQQALGEQAIGGRFYMVIDDGQASGFAFFTDEETAALRAQMPGMIQEPERD